MGLTQRTGTNFLNKLLLMHPEIERSVHPGEDFLLTYSDLLLQYCSQTSNKWSNTWANMDKDKYGSEFRQSFLNTLRDQIKVKTSEHITLTKTPSIEGIQNARTIFPDFHFVIIIRDGRNTIESLVNSFGGGYYRNMISWKKNVCIYLDNIEWITKSSQFTIVKYEDLLSDPTNQIKRILNDAELSEEFYPYYDIDSIPVIGSSQSNNKIGKVDWSVRIDQKSLSFKPNDRFRKWGAKQKILYMLLCKRLNKKLGYE